MTTLASAGVQYAVIAGLSNAYAGYVTTREEYANQRYEGASTHFGPWTLAAYQQEFDKLAVAMRDGLPVDPGPYPTEPTPHLLRASKWEGKPRGKEFGDVKDEASPSYHAGQRVRVAFWAGHPRNDLKIQSSYLAVERKDAANWTVVARDRDWNTRFIWKRTLRGTVAIIEWDIPGGTTPGVYRIRHSGAFRVEGDAKQFYSGVSREFQIN
jgi:neutral ceramidase